MITVNVLSTESARKAWYQRPENGVPDAPPPSALTHSWPVKPLKRRTTPLTPLRVRRGDQFVQTSSARICGDSSSTAIDTAQLPRGHPVPLRARRGARGAREWFYA